MKLVWKLSIPQILIVVCFGMISFFVINSSFSEMRDQYVREIVENRFQLITNEIEASAQKSVNEASLFVNLPAVMEAYEIAGRGDINNINSEQSQEAREFLRRELAPMLDSYYRITGNRLQLHFHLSNSFSLVRLWRERQTMIGGIWVDYSEDLRTVRQTVVDVNTTGEIARGIEPGSGGFAIRGVIPVIGPDGKQVGSAEVLQDFDPILEKVTEEEKIFISLYGNRELRIISIELQDQERYPLKGDFIRIVESKDSTIEDLISTELLSRGREGIYFEDQPSMTLAAYPLADYRGNQVGVIICAVNTSSITKLANTASLVLAIMLAGMAIVPTFALLERMRMLVTRPLNMVNKIIQDIAEDRADLSEHIPSSQKDEIGELATWFNTLTTKLDGILKERQDMLTQISTLKEEKEAELTSKLAQEKDIVRIMKDNINQGVFLMDQEFKILPEYSKPLVTILSYYESELEGRNFLDILASSLNSKQLQTMKNYFSMMFAQSKSPEVLEKSNPIYEFEYKIDNRIKMLSTRFGLVEHTGSEPLVIGIIQDITSEKEFEKELQAQRDAQQQEVKNMFEVIQIDPLVFHDFIDDTESSFNFINSILKDRSLTQNQMLAIFFQNVHAIKSNALGLGLETFGKKLHALEDDVKAVLDSDDSGVDDVLDLAFKLETIMQEKDAYIKIIKQVDAFKASNQIDSVLVQSLGKAVEKAAIETQKKVNLETGELDLTILESKLRKPLKDILFQCIRNSIYHGIETVEERAQKNKKPAGLLVFSIKNINGRAEMIFSDDGRGLDWGKIKDKYLKLHPETKEISKKILLAALFSPEFSTSKEVTTIAGRGVGLSLVKDIVKSNNGSIQVSSFDSGLTLKFSFPLPA